MLDDCRMWKLIRIDGARQSRQIDRRKFVESEPLNGIQNMYKYALLERVCVCLIEQLCDNFF